MSQEKKNFTESPLERRTLIKAAAWSAPVVAVAATAPMAAASVGNITGLTWTGTETNLLSIRLLSGGSVATAGVLMTLPDEFTLANGPGAISGQTATITVVVGRPSGINLSLGRARGFGVYSLDGAVVAGQNSVQYQGTLLKYGFPITTFTGTHTFNVASNGSLAVPIQFGLSGSSDLLSISALASFPVALTVDFGGGNSYTANTSISVPVGAGIL